MTKTKVYVSGAVKLERPRPSCPKCRGLIDGATGLTIGGPPKAIPVPKPGDVSVCGWCGELLEYLADLNVRAMPPKVRAQIPPKARKLLEHLSREIRLNPPPFPKVFE
jgi:hypothetical protein